MFKIAILLKFIDIINTSWYPLQTSGGNLDPLSKLYEYWKIIHSFDEVHQHLLILIPSETSVLS